MSSPISHQTVRLSRGRHSGPDQGACVMELASMLAGERFNDHPRAVDRSIAAFLRSYNDLVDDSRRQDLYAYAAEVVGTAGSGRLETLRARRLVEWGEEMRRGRRRRWSVLPRFSRRGQSRELSPEAAARFAIGAARHITDESHAAALALIDELIDIRAPRSGLDGVEVERPTTRLQHVPAETI